MPYREVINDHGLRGKSSRELATVVCESKDSRERTDAEKELDERKRLRDERRRALRRVAIIIPSLVKITEEELDPENLPSLAAIIAQLDERSWREFMGGLTKKDAINLLPYFNEDVLMASITELLREQKRISELPSLRERYEEENRLESYIKNPDKETVITPQSVAADVIAQAGVPWGEIRRAPLRLYDPGSKGGIFLRLEGLELLRHRTYQTAEELVGPHLFANSLTRASRTRTIRSLGIKRDSVEADNFTAIDVPELRKALGGDETLTAKVCLYANKGLMRQLLPGDRWKQVSETVGALSDAAQDTTGSNHSVGNRAQASFAAMVEQLDMALQDANIPAPLFDYAIGNPPYQSEAEDNIRAAQIYPDFIDMARLVARRVIMIHPARFLFNVGHTSKDWNRRIIADPELEVIEYYPQSQQVFPSVDIKGGVAITSFTRGRADGGYPNGFAANQTLADIRDKVWAKPQASMRDHVSPEVPFKYRDETVAGNVDTGIRSGAFTREAGLFRTVAQDNDAIFFGLFENKRVWRHIDRELIADNPLLDSWKMFVSKASGSGAFGRRSARRRLVLQEPAAPRRFSLSADLTANLKGKRC